MSTPVRSPRSRASLAAALTLAAGLALTACGAGDSSGSSGDSAVGGGQVQEQSAPRAGDLTSGDAPAADAAKGAPQTGTGATVDLATSTRKLTRRADISLTVDDVDTAAGQVRAAAAAEDGMVLAEAVSSEPEDAQTGGYSTVTISVPSDRLDATLDRLSKIGDVHSRNASTDDVTAQYVDTESRVETMKASVERVRALMGQATKLADIVNLEAELSRRQADLEATQSQLAALKDAVAMSPVEVRLSTDVKVLEEAEDDTGFLAGLTAGWTAFTGSVAVLLTVLGAVLPFAVAFALVGIPVLTWLRRRGPRASNVPPPMAAAPPTA